jgi:hypothetical protein
MKKRLMCLASVAVALTAVVGTARADESLLDFDNAVSALAAFDPTLDPPPRDGNKDFVVGGFKAYGFNNGLSVRSGPGGEDPSGMASVTDPDTGFKIRENAVCLAVQGNLAAAGFRGTFNAFPGEEYVEIDVFRDGGPGGALDGFDAYLPFQVGALGPEQCENALALAAIATPIEGGNILVNDAQ